jgi:hypothetical protein
MKRFFLILINEFKFARTTIPIHIVAMLQPTVMYLLMATILVHPTFAMNVVEPRDPLGWALVEAMRAVGSPVGEDYIEVNLVAGGPRRPTELRQLVTFQERDGGATAVQVYGLIDSNLVKNYRNRLTAAALRLWQDELGGRAVTIEEHPWLRRDVPYQVYFGMALLPMAAAIAAASIGGILTAQEFERGTISQYRLSPVPAALLLGARLARLTLTGLLSAGVLLAAVGAVTGYWPGALCKVVVTLLPIGLIAGGVGVTAGLWFQKTIPTFIIALASSFLGWLLGSAFGLAGGFGPGYAAASSLTPNTYAVELLFPCYFGAPVGSPLASALALAGMSLAATSLTLFVYYQRVVKQE